jgi:hypothetical protein
MIDKHIGFPVDHSALLRDLWARKDYGTFIGNYASPNTIFYSLLFVLVIIKSNKDE